MVEQQFDDLLDFYNPWWRDVCGPWRDAIPDFRRSVVAAILADLAAIPQIISVTGPRRVGKTTALRHVVCHLLDEEKVPAERIVYLSFDDPIIQGSAALQRDLFERLIKRHGLRPGKAEPVYFFLDEVQRLPQWELHLKKYYDAHYPVRFLVSGSASSPIFRKSHESLAGRIKDRHLLPFDFREFCLWRHSDDPAFTRLLGDLPSLKPPLLSGDGSACVEILNAMRGALSAHGKRIEQAFDLYCRNGGFPEVWALDDPARRVEYLFDNVVRKVLFENLMGVRGYRRPENVLRMLVQILAHPGMELNVLKVAREAEVERRVIDENLPLLEMTDLIVRLWKFHRTPFRLKSGNMKCYPIDLALRHAMLKRWDDAPLGSELVGLFAENLVVRTLKEWPETLEIAFFREKDIEVDFVVTHGANRFLPIEVKHRKARDRARGLIYFMRRFGVDFGVVVTRDREIRHEQGILYLPLRYLLLAH